eukprot:jgi/Chrzof1/11365/Cz05g34050.t1
MTERSRTESGEIRKFTATAFAEATFGKAASAVAKAEGKDPIDVMRETPNSEYYNEARFGKQLHDAANEAVEEEMRAHGHIGRDSVASKLQAAAEDFDRMKQADNIDKMASNLV